MSLDQFFLLNDVLMIEMLISVPLICCSSCVLEYSTVCQLNIVMASWLMNVMIDVDVASFYLGMLFSYTISSWLWYAFYLISMPLLPCWWLLIAAHESSLSWFLMLCTAMLWHISWNALLPAICVMPLIVLALLVWTPALLLICVTMPVCFLLSMYETWSAYGWYEYMLVWMLIALFSVLCLWWPVDSLELTLLLLALIPLVFLPLLWIVLIDCWFDFINNSLLNVYLCCPWILLALW